MAAADRPAETSGGMSFLRELADIFSRIGAVLSDPEVQEAGDRFFKLMTDKVAELEPGRPRLMQLGTHSPDTEGDSQ